MQAVFAEPLAAAFEILEQVEIGPSTRALVLGDGKLGFSSWRACSPGRGSARVTTGRRSRHADQARALRAAGVETVARASGAYGSGFDVVVEATGTAAGLEAAIAATRPRGMLVLKSTVAGKATVDLAPLVIHEITLVGSRCVARFSRPWRRSRARTCRRSPARAPSTCSRAARRAAEPAVRSATADVRAWWACRRRRTAKRSRCPPPGAGRGRRSRSRGFWDRVAGSRGSVASDSTVRSARDRASRRSLDAASPSSMRASTAVMLSVPPK